MDAALTTSLILLAVVVLVAINLVAFATFGIDKRLAESGARHIPESTLLALALWGGSPGAYAGRHVFRHKTRKQPFSDDLFKIVVLQVMVLAGSATWFLSA